MSMHLRRFAGVALACLLFSAVSSEFLVVHSSAAHAATDDDSTADEGSAATTTKVAAKPSALMWLIHTSGWIGGFLLLVSIYFVALVVQLFVELQADKITPEPLVQEWDAMLAKRDYQGIYRVAKDDRSELGRLVAAGMLSLSAGLSEAREAMDRLGESITVEMEKRISMLAVIGSLGPLVGLLGTLKGMISSFSVIAMSDTQLKASEVAGGISEALILTFEGVALSVPAIYFFAVFKNRVSVFSVQALNLADDFIRRVHVSSHTKQQPAA